ncbi:MAG: aminoglycoside 6-adenylyltransferase [Limnochordia bacterium]|nr:aminoglycoside 6-adenylyltransferase [Limnochordia bacterium]
MRDEATVLETLQAWAEKDECIRGMVLTSSRVIPGSTIDFLSDYDIELYVSDLTPFAANDDWLAFLGSIMVRWPYKPRSTMEPDWITRLVLFRDGVRVDFQITANLEVRADAYANGRKILIDKDQLFDCLVEPTYTKYLVKTPTPQQYEELVQEFWWDAIYVPKCLCRGELPFAKYMLDHMLRHHFLHPMIEWYIGTITDWTANPGVWGRRFKYYLDRELSWQLEATYAGADLGENWDAFFNMLDLFSSLAREVGSYLGLEYPTDIEDDVRQYCQWIQGQ